MLPALRDNLSLDEDSDEESDTEFLMDVLVNLPRIRSSPSRPQIFDTMHDDDFRRRFRFSKETVQRILDLIHDRIATRTKRNRATDPMHRLLLTLRFYATGTYQAVFGDIFKVHRTTAGRIVRDVTSALVSLRPHFIKMPTTDEELQMTMMNFYNFVEPHGIPGVVGLIDGTHVKIISPRKSYFIKQS